MITFPALSGVEINVFLLVFIGLGAGILSGFSGVGGFVVTPALIILGFPANLAVGTSLAWVTSNSIVGTFQHRKLGNVDMKLGVVLLLASMSGMEVGVRTLNWAQNSGVDNEVVLSISLCMLLIVGSYTLLESIQRKKYLDNMLEKGERPPAMRATAFSQRLQGIKIIPMLHFTKSGITVSLWVVLALGFLIGMLAGLIGVGGGFIMVPSLVYLVGLPSFMAVGTVLFQIIFSAAFGTFRHTMSGNVVIFAAFIMVISSSIGVQFGTLVTRFVRGVSTRFILSISILLAAAGTILKLLSLTMKSLTTPLEVASLAVTFSGMGVAIVIITLLFIMALRYRSGRSIPPWIAAFLATGDSPAGK